jgi:hypothetical protein
MLQNDNATSVPEQDTLMNTTQNVTSDDLMTNLDAVNDAIQLVAEGEWKDRRITVTGQIDEIFPIKTNRVGKAQRSIRVIREDGSPILISAFDGNVKSLDGRKLGNTYSFRGKLKTKTEIFDGKERTSEFLNL